MITYTFGKMNIDNRIFTSDLIIFPDGRIQENWRRRSGHVLTMADLDSLKEACPSLIIAGTGAHGRMVPAPDLPARLAKLNIEIQALTTAEAVALYNDLASRGKFPAACFHLTC